MWMPLTLGLMALGCLGVAARGIVTNRPFVFTPRWFLAGVAALFSLNFAIVVRRAIRTAPPVGGIDLTPLLLPGVLAVIAVLLLIEFRGFVAVGVSGPLFREALFVAIKKLGLKFEQEFSIVRLPSVRAEVQMSVQSWVGTAQIKPRRVRGFRAVRDIARGMNAYFTSRKVGASSIAFTYYLFLAVMLAIMAFQLWPE